VTRNLEVNFVGYFDEGFGGLPALKFQLNVERGLFCGWFEYSEDVNDWLFVVCMAREFCNYDLNLPVTVVVCFLNTHTSDF